VRPVLIVRPEPGNAATAAVVKRRGLDAVRSPLTEIVPLEWAAPDPARFDAVLLGSANAVRCGGPGLGRLKTLPAYCVGEATAQVAKDAGFSVAAVGEGELQDLLPRLAGDRCTRALRPAGIERVALTAPEGLTIDTVEVYAAELRPLSEAGATALRHGAVVLLHSAASAARLLDECARLGIAHDTVPIACLGPRIAAAAGAGWRAVAFADQPTDAALLALAGEMCQTAGCGVSTNTTG